MKTTKTSSHALGALLLSLGLASVGTGVAIAQTTTAEPATVDPATVDPAADPAATEPPPKPVQGQMTMQSENTVLASNLIGATVYSLEDESVGDISDLVVNLDGKVEGVVVGVGGFLGMGEKSVAVEMSALSLSMTPEQEPRLVLQSTKADLEAAPEFVSVEDQQDEADAAAARESMQAPTPTATGAGTAAGTGTMAPADPVVAPADTTAEPADTAKTQ